MEYFWIDWSSYVANNLYYHKKEKRKKIKLLFQRIIVIKKCQIVGLNQTPQISHHQVSHDRAHTAAAFFFIVLGLILLIALTVGLTQETDPQTIQNILILILACFGSYFFFMRTFFKNEDDRSKRIQTHFGLIIVNACFFSLRYFFSTLSKTLLGQEIVVEEINLSEYELPATLFKGMLLLAVIALLMWEIIYEKI